MATSRDQRSAKANETTEHVQSITERQLEEALEKQRRSGKSLWEILMSDLSLKSIKELLTYRLMPKDKPIGKYVVESGYATQEELGELVQDEEDKGALRTGEVLIDKGLITRAQLGEALIEQERTGHHITRVLLNLGYVNTKQLSDTLRGDAPHVEVKLRREKIVDAVLKRDLIQHEDLMEMNREAENTGRDLAEMLVESGVVSANELGKILEDELGVRYVSLSHYDIDSDVANMLPESLVRGRHALPVSIKDGKLQVAMSDPEDISVIDDISMITGYDVEPLLVWDHQLQNAIRRYRGDGEEQESEGRETAAKGTTRKRRGKKDEVRGEVQKHDRRPKQVKTEGKRLDELVESVSVVNLVASIVEGAINSEATDIHLEPQEGHLRVRYRIDGMLYDVMTIPEAVHEGILSRVKILANMDITQKRLPQDGHFSMDIKDRTYDMRIATLPTSLGERLVIRLLNPANVLLGMKQLGLSSDDYQKADSLIHQPSGMFMVTGPIGSGKTTTLYGALNQINVLSDSIVTIEDPIEYQLPGINQVQVDPRIDRTFARVLRSVLRQDVNTMLVGEIRDTETAHIAVRAAVTGHLVFTTLHTRNAVGAIMTLINFDVPRFLITNSVTGIVNQRLVRLVCPHCKQEYTPGEQLLKELEIDPEEGKDLKFVRGTGCSACYHTGYHGRTGIFEVLLVTDRIKDLILARASEEEVVEAAREEGMSLLYDDAIDKLKRQITSAEEVVRTVMTHI